jgi:BTB/POZ domain
MSSQGGLSRKKKQNVAASLDGDGEAGKRFKSMMSNDAFNSDDELPQESFEERLSWRSDDSFSDWTIIIRVEAESISHPADEGDDGREDVNRKKSGANKEFTYHVHKNILALGPRRSEYFVRLFESEGTFAESQDNTSRIELHDLAAKAFPEFLDHMYYYKTGVGNEVEFTTDNATALYSLAKYFEVRRLCHDAKKFCLQDLQTSKTCSTYYDHAKQLQASSILEATTNYCVRSDMSLFTHSRLLHVTDAQFWIDLMEERLRQPINWSGIRWRDIEMSQLLAAFCQIHSVSFEVFQQLTAEKYLQYIHPKAALQLLSLERQLVSLFRQQFFGDKDNNADDDNDDEGEQLSNLQKRCVIAIVEHSKRKDLARNGKLFRDLPRHILREIILRFTDGRS